MILDDLLDLKKYMESHCSRLTLDIKRESEKHDTVQEEFYKGAKQSTEMFVRLIGDIIEKN